MNQVPIKVLGLIAGVALLAGVGATFAGCSILSKAKEAKTWPSTDGTIQSSKVVELEKLDDDGKTQITYSADVVYSYAVDGRSYKGTRLDPTGMTSSSSSAGDAEATVRRYPPGAGVRVYYSPKDPSDSALSNEAGAARFMVLGIGLVFTAVGLALAWATVQAIRSRRRPAPEDAQASRLRKRSSTQRLRATKQSAAPAKATRTPVVVGPRTSDATPGPMPSKAAAKSRPLRFQAKSPAPTAPRATAIHPQ